MVRAEHGAPPAHLVGKEKHTLDEALRLGEDMAEEVESSVSAYGRWLLANVFDNDATAALDVRSNNRVWLELVRRAGGPTLRVSRRILDVAVRIAANDKRINDQSWRGLDSGRKELLLPLVDTKRLREAAQHIAKFDLSQAKTREYVAQLLAEEGRARQVRITPALLTSRVKKLRETFKGAAVLKRVKAMGGKLQDAERRAVTDEIEALRTLLAELSTALQG